MAAAAPGAAGGHVYPGCDRRGSEDLGSGAEWKALWRVLELAGVGKTESGRYNHCGDVGERGGGVGVPALERWSESQSVAGERREREGESPGLWPGDGREASMPDTPTGGDSGRQPRFLPGQ